MSLVSLLLVCGFFSLTTGTVSGLDAVNRELLISIQQREDGIRLYTIQERLSEEDGRSKSNTFQTKNIPEVTLSPDCGPGYFRCSPKVIPSTASQNDNNILVPLDRGLLIVEVKYSNKSSKATFGSYRVIETPQRYCSPTAFLEIFDNLYTVCTDQENNRVTFFEIRFNTTSVLQSQLIGPLATVWVTNVTNLSNFLLSTVIPHQPLVYFAEDNYLYTVSLVDDLLEDGPRRIGTNCGHIHRLIPAPQSQLLAYCLSHYVHYDIVQEASLTREYSYAESGVPYLCPDQSYVINAYENHLSYTIGSEEHTMQDVSVASGVCINGSAGGVNIFAYTNKAANSTAFIELSGESQITKTALCSSQDCRPIVTFEHPVHYLLIRQGVGDLEKVALVSVENNKVEPIISVDKLEAADMFTLVTVKDIYDQRRHHSFILVAVVSGVVGTIVVMLIIVLMLAIGFVCRYHHNRHGEMHDIVVPVSENEHGTHDQCTGQGMSVCQSMHETRPPAPIPLQVSPDGHTATSERQPGNGKIIESEAQDSSDQSMRKVLGTAESITIQAFASPSTNVDLSGTSLADTLTAAAPLNQLGQPETMQELAGHTDLATSTDHDGHTEGSNAGTLYRLQGANNSDTSSNDSTADSESEPLIPDNNFVM